MTAAAPVKKAIAIYTVHLPGNVAVDANGNSLSKSDTLNIIYLETGPGNIHWKKAWKDNQYYSVIVTVIMQPSVDAGVDKKTNEKISLRAMDGNTLWKLSLVADGKFHPSSSKNSNSEIVLTGIYHGKKITQKIGAPREVNSIPSF